MGGATKRYRGWKLERIIGATWFRTDKDKNGLPVERRSKWSGWHIHYPDGGCRSADTLAEAREYIDSYLGETA